MLVRAHMYNSKDKLCRLLLPEWFYVYHIQHLMQALALMRKKDERMKKDSKILLLLEQVLGGIYDLVQIR